MAFQMKGAGAPMMGAKKPNPFAKMGNNTKKPKKMRVPKAATDPTDTGDDGMTGGNAGRSMMASGLTRKAPMGSGY